MQEPIPIVVKTVEWPTPPQPIVINHTYPDQPQKTRGEKLAQLGSIASGFAAAVALLWNMFSFQEVADHQAAAAATQIYSDYLKDLEVYEGEKGLRLATTRAEAIYLNIRGDKAWETTVRAVIEEIAVKFTGISWHCGSLSEEFRGFVSGVLKENAPCPAQGSGQ